MKRILLPIRDTRRDTGRGLSNTNLESKHSWRIKLLKKKQEKLVISNHRVILIKQSNLVFFQMFTRTSIQWNHKHIMTRINFSIKSLYFKCSIIESD